MSTSTPTVTRPRTVAAGPPQPRRTAAPAPRVPAIETLGGSAYTDRRTELIGQIRPRRWE